MNRRRQSNNLLEVERSRYLMTLHLLVDYFPSSNNTSYCKETSLILYLNDQGPRNRKQLENDLRINGGLYRNFGKVTFSLSQVAYFVPRKKKSKSLNTPIDQLFLTLFPMGSGQPLFPLGGQYSPCLKSQNMVGWG